MEVTDGGDSRLSLLDWRRQTASAYAAVRNSPSPRSGWEGWRAARDRLFAGHPQSPLESREGFAGLPFAPYDERWRFTARLTETEPARRPVPTSDGTVLLDRVGRIDLPVGSLDVWWVAGYGGGLFLPFGDSTNGESTYGGGRYLLDTIKGADLGEQDGELVVDFNFAYHPSCCYSSRWSCPLPAPENRLQVRVEAGEQLGGSVGTRR
ncbi:MAG: DUF1684 domain-containing protein [Actinomycetota bacterium]|nr:DUF1684 domain-containing protein [Actinomycetota bacterium]